MNYIEVMVLNRSVAVGAGCLVSLSLCVSILDFTCSRFTKKAFLFENLLQVDALLLCSLLV